MYLLPEEFEISGENILYLSIPESSQVHRVNGMIFDRNEDGDLNITSQSDAVARLYIRKQTSYSENKIYPFVEIADLREDLIKQVRKMVSLRESSHLWIKLDDMEKIVK